MEMILSAQPLDGFRVGSPGRISIRFDICVCHEDLCHASYHLVEVVLLNGRMHARQVLAGAGKCLYAVWMRCFPTIKLGSTSREAIESTPSSPYYSIFPGYADLWAIGKQQASSQSTPSILGFKTLGCTICRDTIEAGPLAIPPCAFLRLPSFFSLSPPCAGYRSS